MGIKVNKDIDVLTKKLIEINFKANTDLIMLFKQNNKILFEMKVHKLILTALPTQYFDELIKGDDDKFTLTIPNVNAEILHAIFCRIYGMENNIFESKNLEELFWKYYLQLHLVHRFFCLPNILFKDLCVLFYGHELYNEKIKPETYIPNYTTIIDDGNIYNLVSVPSERQKKLQLQYLANLFSETDDKLFLPRHLKILPEDFNLLLCVIEIIGYSRRHYSIILSNAPSDYTSRISANLSNALLEFVRNRCTIAYYEK